MVLVVPSDDAYHHVGSNLPLKNFITTDTAKVASEKCIICPDIISAHMLQSPVHPEYPQEAHNAFTSKVCFWFPYHPPIIQDAACTLLIVLA